MVSEKVKQLEQENIILKRQVEELQSICGSGADMPKNCEYCSNFTQHYFRSGGAYYPMYSGHCNAGNRVKSRKTNDTCKAFARKEYGKNCI